MSLLKKIESTFLGKSQQNSDFLAHFGKGISKLLELVTNPFVCKTNPISILMHQMRISTNGTQAKKVGNLGKN
jgi:hypothetical protein